MHSTDAGIPVRSRLPFRFDLSLAYFRRRAGELVDVTEGRVYRRLLLVDRSHLLVEARAIDDSEAPGLRVRALAGQVDALPIAAGALKRAFGLDDDLDALRQHTAGDSVLAMLFARYCGLRLVRTQSAFEALVWAVIGQQINLTFAFRLKSMLVREFGHSVEFEGRTYWAFPGPGRLAGADESSLAASGLGRRKAATIISVAQAIAGATLSLEALADLHRAEAEARLVALPGVGPWTAHYTMLRGLGDFGAFPAADLGLRVAVGRLYGGSGAAPLTQMRELAAQWGEWRGYIAFYLWNSLAERAA